MSTRQQAIDSKEALETCVEWQPSRARQHGKTMPPASRDVKGPGGPLQTLAQCLPDNEMQLCFNLVGLLFSAHVCLPATRPYTAAFFTLSYLEPTRGRYAAGPADLCFVAFFIVLFTGLRACAMQHVFTPLARRWGIAKPKDLTRFAEQAYLVVYYGIFSPLGTYIYCTSPYFLDMRELWTDWPQRELDGLTKAYVLVQLVFWIQQVIVVQIEEHRKDHWQMVTHHLVTVALVAGAYVYHQTRVGNLILVLMDGVEVFLPLAKCLRYLGMYKACDAVFSLFTVSWFVARHVLYPMTCWSVWADVPRVMAVGCYRGAMDNLKGPFAAPRGAWRLLEPFFNPRGIVCFDDPVRLSFLAFLLVLQVLTIIWFVLIVRVVVRVLQGNPAQDDRSDDEDEGDAEAKTEKE